jgi:MFS family permease
MSTPELEGVAPVEPAAPSHPPGAPAREGEWLRPGMAWYAVAMVALVTVFGQIDFGIMSLLVTPIKRDTHMTDTQISILLGVAYSSVYLLTGLPMARIADRARRTVLLPAALAVWSVGSLLLGLAHTFWQFVLFRGIVGGGVAVKGPTSVSLIPDLVPREKLARAFGIYNVAIMGGQALSMILGGLLLGMLIHRPPITLPLVGTVHAWQMVFIIMGLPGVVVAAVFMLTVPEPIRQGRKTSGSVPIGEVARFLLRGPASRVFIPIIIGTAITGIFISGVGNWRPAFFERTYGMGAHQYGPIAGLIMLVTAPVGVAIGAFVSERMHRRWDDAHQRLVVAVHLITLPIWIMAPLMPNATLALACQVATGILTMVSAPSALAAMQIITPNNMRAQVNAAYMITISVIGTGLGPTVVALITDYLLHAESELRYAMLALTVVATPVALLCQWLALKPYGKLHRQVIEAERG